MMWTALASRRDIEKRIRLGEAMEEASGVSAVAVAVAAAALGACLGYIS